jgi:hypothetical protein
MSFLLRWVSAWTALCLLTPLTLAAQSASGGATIGDSGTTRHQSPMDAWPQRGWISLGLGAGSWPSGSLAGIAAGWYSVGPVVAGVRFGGTTQLRFDETGEERNDAAFLVGLRTRESRRFLLAAIGTAKVSSTSNLCSGGCAQTSPFNTTEAAYALEAHANFKLLGVGATMFGALGPPSSRYNSFALTLDVGWFGR